MAVGVLALGSIYSLWYQQWKTNNKVYAFILFGAGQKVHALNLGARQLNVSDRAKIVRVIVKLTKIKQSTKYNGALLYRIFKMYLPREMNKCYRTYYRQWITRSALINYGLNSEEDFSELELKFQDKNLSAQAKNDFLVKMLNMATGRGTAMTATTSTFAKPIEDATPIKPTPTGTKPPAEPDDDDSGPDGYY